MPVPVRGLGYFAGSSKQDDFDFATAYANNLSTIKAEYKARGIIPTAQEVQHARIKSAVHAVTDLHDGRDTMGAFFLESQDPEDGLFGNLMPEIDWF